MSTLDLAIRILPASETVGAIVTGVDLSQRLHPGTIQILKDALARHLVLVYRDQDLAPDDLVRYSRQFGELDPAPLSEWGRQCLPGHEEIYLISNIVENGRPIGALGAGESEWHSDMNFEKVPPFGSCLYGVEVPKDGGNTGFISAFAAYERLPDDLKAFIEDLSLKHDATTNSGGALRKGHVAPTDLTVSPGEIHPLVKVDPETGRKALFLGRRRYAYVMDLPIADSEALLDELWYHVTELTPSWHHRWRVCDLVQWDNRWTMHRRDPFPGDQRRLMYRTQIRGTAA
ncbi:TauD/TfdA dioxygenase family protein [Acuticoccus sediminis]|uniref:TauD/TfdA dioxygenase family protein n=1 Tax=Acuticoccus sediminis TaxID=2184697 RepID=UPI001CFCA906|nr:TauD/TfdA family dioxygenase [Acuticoccus sediminis]